MAMIGAFKLVLDKHPCARADILAQDVSAERADSLFLRFQFQVDPERLTQDGEILFPCEPGREVACFTGPDFAEIDAGKSAQRVLAHSPASISIEAAAVARSWPAAMVCLTRFSTSVGARPYDDRGPAATGGIRVPGSSQVHSRPFRRSEPAGFRRFTWNPVFLSAEQGGPVLRPQGHPGGVSSTERAL